MVEGNLKRSDRNIYAGTTERLGDMPSRPKMTPQRRQTVTERKILASPGHLQSLIPGLVSIIGRFGCRSAVIVPSLPLAKPSTSQIFFLDHSKQNFHLPRTNA